MKNGGSKIDPPLKKKKKTTFKKPSLTMVKNIDKILMSKSLEVWEQVHENYGINKRHHQIETKCEENEAGLNF